MNLKTTFENQKMTSCSLCNLFRRSPLQWIAVLVSLLLIVLLSGFLGFGYYYLSILILSTSLVLIISIVFLTFSKQKPLLLLPPYSTTLLQMDQEVLPENETIVQKKKEAQRGSMNQMIDDCSVRSSSSDESLSDTTLPEIMEGVLSNLQLENENPAAQKKKKKEAHQEGGMHQIHENCLVISSRSSDSLSESESVEDSSTSEDSETTDCWLFQDNVQQMNQSSSVCSDGSISDEESLIEIALPTGHYVSSSTPSSSNDQKDPKLKKLHKKMPDFMAKSIFQQHSNSLMEQLLAEINEENLIEIDISMGSIKCSRFEIEA